MGLVDNIQTETVAGLPLREALLVSPRLIIRAAIAMMKRKQLGCVIAVDALARPVGTFTERSIIRLITEDPSVLDRRPVGDYLDPKWAVVKESEPVLAALEAMRKEDLRFVVVTNDVGRVTALTGQKGMMEYIAEHYPQQVMVQQAGTKPSVEREGA